MVDAEMKRAASAPSLTPGDRGRLLAVWRSCAQRLAAPGRKASG